MNKEGFPFALLFIAIIGTIFATVLGMIAAGLAVLSGENWVPWTVGTGLIAWAIGAGLAIWVIIEDKASR